MIICGSSKLAEAYGFKHHTHTSVFLPWDIGALSIIQYLSKKMKVNTVMTKIAISAMKAINPSVPSVILTRPKAVQNTIKG